jgi:hypothetical protein
LWALLQAFVAVTAVGLAAAPLNVRASAVNGTANVIETAGYVLMIIGLRLYG